MEKELLMLIRPVLPEIVLLFFSLCALLAGVFRPNYSGKVNAARLIYAGFGTALFLLFFVINIPPQGLAVRPLFLLDPYAVYVKKFILIGGIIGLAYGNDWLQYKKFSRFEYTFLLALSVIGMMLAVSSDNFLMLFLGLETAQLPVCFMTAYKRQGERSTEAGAKYIIISILASGLFLFGVSVLYVCLGTVDFGHIASADKQNVMTSFLLGVAFISAGMLLRLGAAPFHAWTADIYEGAPTPVTAFMAVVLRFSLIAAFARVVLVPFASLSFFWTPVFSVVSVLSVFIGAFGALAQTNIKRMAAYTAVALNGFALSAFITGNGASLLFFLSVDFILMAGLFAVILSLRIGGDLSEKIQTLAGQAKLKPVRGALFSLIFLGVAGLPPFAGFWGRFFLFEETVKTFHLGLAVCLMAGGILLAYVYLKLIRQMYFSPSKDELLAASRPMRVMIWVSAAVSVLMLAYVSPLWEAAVKAAASLGG